MVNLGTLMTSLYTSNDSSGFGKSFQTIYPQVLALKLEHKYTKTTFLDIDIKSSKFITTFSDEKDVFEFLIFKIP